MVKHYPLLNFFILTFAITWGLGALTLLLDERLPVLLREFGPGNPVFNVAVYAPAIAAFVIIGLFRGKKGLLAYLCRFLQWDIKIRWYILVLLGIPILYFFIRVLSHLFIGTTLEYPTDSWRAVMPTALWTVVYRPGLLEEIGWRGFALPLLQSKYSALGASLILGLIWAVWHLPGFFVVEYYKESGNVLTSFTLFTVSVCAISVLMTVIYNGSNGSIPLAILAHWLFNDPFNLKNDPVDTLIYTAVLVVAAVIAVVIAGYRNLGQAKCTEVFPDSAAKPGELGGRNSNP